MAETAAGAQVKMMRRLVGYASIIPNWAMESRPGLWKRLVEDFGPKRKTDDK